MTRVQRHLGLFVLILLLVPPPASQARAVFSSEVKIRATAESSGSHLSGQVTSHEKACLKGRLVTLFRQRANASTFSVVARVASSPNGNWRLTSPSIVPPGRYRARVALRSVNEGICDAATSATVAWTPKKRAPVPAFVRLPAPPRVPLTCDPGYVPGKIPGEEAEYCLPTPGPPIAADCAVGYHLRENYLDQCVPDDRSDTRH